MGGRIQSAESKAASRIGRSSDADSSGEWSHPVGGVQSSEQGVCQLEPDATEANLVAIALPSATAERKWSALASSQGHMLLSLPLSWLSQVTRDFATFSQHAVDLVLLCELHENHHNRATLPPNWQRIRADEF